MIDSDGSGSTGVQAGRVVLSPEQQRSQRSCLPLTHLSQVCASFQTLNSLTLSWELEIGCGGGIYTMEIRTHHKSGVSPSFIFVVDINADVLISPLFPPPPIPHPDFPLAVTTL